MSRGPVIWPSRQEGAAGKRTQVGQSSAAGSPRQRLGRESQRVTTSHIAGRAAMARCFGLFGGALRSLALQGKGSDVPEASACGRGQLAQSHTRVVQRNSDLGSALRFAAPFSSRHGAWQYAESLTAVACGCAPARE